MNKKVLYFVEQDVSVCNGAVFSFARMIGILLLLFFSGISSQTPFFLAMSSSSNDLFPILPTFFYVTDSG